MILGCLKYANPLGIGPSLISREGLTFDRRRQVLYLTHGAAGIGLGVNTLSTSIIKEAHQAKGIGHGKPDLG